MEEFGSKGEMRLRFRLTTISAGPLGDKERYDKCQDGRCEDVIKLFRKILCISCCTVESFAGSRGRLLV